MTVSFRNRSINTVAIAPRTAGTVLYGGLDLANTAVTYPKQIFEALSDTFQNTKGVFKEAFGTKGKRWQKILSPLAATATLGEGAVRSVLNPTWNAVLHTKDTVGNMLVNEGNSIKHILEPNKPSEFKFHHLEDNKHEISKTNTVANRWTKMTNRTSIKEDTKAKLASVLSENEALQKKNKELESKVVQMETKKPSTEQKIPA